MKTNNKLTIALLIGAVVSGCAGWFFTQTYLETEKTSYREKVERTMQMIPVVVASRNLTVGEAVDGSTAQVRQMPRDFIHKDAVAPGQFEARLEGRQLVHAVKAGEPILPIHVSSVKVEGLSSLLTEGQRALTIPVTSLDVNSGFLNPGDHVDIYITLRDGARDRTVPLAENLRVLASGNDLDDGLREKQKTGVREITLAVTPLNATKIIHGQTVGTLAVLMRRKDDESSSFEDYVTIDNLIDIPQEAPPQPARRATWGFELIKGGNRS